MIDRKTLERAEREDLAAVTPDSALHQSYFPERTLAQWLRRHGYLFTVYAFPLRMSMQPKGLRGSAGIAAGTVRVARAVSLEGSVAVRVRDAGNA
ncbi:hypothetical protein [Streptomyces canus]|uniref:hypothetical protein n=1 Tax=Streptomyces canus TaxID=58343 RepID=UPI003818A063